MKVDAYNQIAQLYQSTQHKVAAGKPDKKEGQTDTLQLSQTAKDIQTVKQAVKDAPDVRADKVAALKERLASGTYDITGADLAEKLLNNNFNGLA